ncbi:M13 family metallopeptidase [Luteibacter sp. CQ10]|uniref:M13 family metallopeptidase n=1 Tax=Luteibacter sp. CQ10 TaxID=2805821 RepID=UPI0034A31364
MIKILIAAIAISAATAATYDTSGMDRNVRPGDDFYLYANGAWQRDTPVPPEDGVVRGDALARKASIQRLTSIVKEEANRPASRAGMLFRAYTDEVTINRLGLKPVMPMIDEVMALRTRDDLAEAMARFARRGTDTLFSGYAGGDDRHPDRNTLWWSSAGLGMGDRGYYQPDGPRGTEALGAYTTYVRKLLTVAGIEDSAPLAERVVSFERELAAPKPPEAGEVIFDEVSATDLGRRMPGIDWARVIRAFGWPAGRRMRIEEPAVMKSRMAAFTRAPLDTLRAYLIVHLLDAYAPYLSDDVKDLAFNFNKGFLRGIQVQKSREETGTLLVDDLVPDEIERIYVARYFPPESKARIRELADNVKAAFGKRLAGEGWMDAKTKKRALAKLANVRIEIGYPDVWNDYAGLDFKEGDLLGDVIGTKEWSWQYKLGKLDKPVDRRGWDCLEPSTVNACSDTGRLVLYFPAAYLQPPLFDPGYDAADVYGRLGSTIGHELTHQFDPNGATVDENGIRNPWWPAPVQEAFLSRTRRLEEQYGRYEVAPGLHVDGRRTIGENTADLGGLNIAFDAFRASLAGRELPVIDGLTGNQRFFIAYAEDHRVKFSDARLRAQLLNDHAPGHERAWEVRNITAWYDAFDVKPGDGLYLAPKDRVSIW